MLTDDAVVEGNHPFGAVLVSANGVVFVERKNSRSIAPCPGHAEANFVWYKARLFDINDASNEIMIGAWHELTRNAVDAT